MWTAEKELRFQITPEWCGRAIRILKPYVPLGTKCTGNGVTKTKRLTDNRFRGKSEHPDNVV